MICCQLLMDSRGWTTSRQGNGRCRSEFLWKNKFNHLWDHRVYIFGRYYLPKTSFLIRQNTLTFLTREGQILWSFAQKIAVLGYFLFKFLKSTTIHKNATIYDSKMPQTSIQKHQTKFWHFYEFCNILVYILKKNLTFENENGQSSSCLLKWLKRTD